MKKSRARLTVILASVLFMVAACYDTSRPDRPARDPAQQNVRSHNSNSPGTVSLTYENEVIGTEIEDGDCHDPDCSPVAGGGVILFSDGECRLQAVDAKTGKRKWRFAPEKGADYFPVVYDGSAYVAVSKRLYALDVKTGRVRWKRKFKGYVNTPKLAGGLLLFTANDESIYAVSAKTGKRKWRYKTEDPNCTIFLADEKRAYIESECDIHAVDLETGKRAWRYDTDGCSPLALAASQGMVCAGLGDGTIIALDAETGHESWKLKTEFDTPLVRADGDSLYFGNWLRLQAVDVRTGEVKWLSEKGYNRVGYITAIADGEIYFDDADFIYSVNALTGQESWRYQRKEWDHSPLVIADKKIFFTDGLDFYAVDAPTKKQLWKIKLNEDNGVYTAPVVTSGAVNFIEGCAVMSAADIKTGKLRWTFTP
ncbi:MAG TPA: PQQ-binding-like beta-propeller repeat protein [Blastocatellia bacterium]|nr:PQQ-binding-like beta-propeller repeat protein [Blastocatellia bacterium]